jgi:hypothetical protein
MFCVHAVHVLAQYGPHFTGLDHAVDCAPHLAVQVNGGAVSGSTASLDCPQSGVAHGTAPESAQVGDQDAGEQRSHEPVLAATHASLSSPQE